MPYWSSATLGPALDYSREQQSAAPSPEIFFVKHLTEEAMEGLTAQLEEMDLEAGHKPRVGGNGSQSSDVAADRDQPSPAPVQIETQARPLKPQQVVGDP
ncbi:hypothetical protein N7507_010539 [Penicillium longicatenatum]|nr:hypothetical protein N7507_010539 [Penicillium longicatenatum]